MIFGSLRFPNSNPDLKRFIETRACYNEIQKTHFTGAIFPSSALQLPAECNGILDGKISGYLQLKNWSNFAIWIKLNVDSPDPEWVRYKDLLIRYNNPEGENQEEVYGMVSQ